MKLLQTVFVCTLMLIATTAVAAKQEKELICHVGNEVGPGPDFDVYLDDPDCVPHYDNDYFCPDAGKIDLISVAKASKHLGNPSHMYDGISDYTPEEVYASGDSTEDSNDDGIDDGCEPFNGDTPVGTITSDIIRGGTPPGSDRGVESAAVNLVADAQLWATLSNDADVAFMNPGGVRSDLTYADSGGEGDGVVTFGEAFTFQPFGNTLITLPMNGAQIISVLEEQCQPLGSSRPFQHLGVSDGFTYDLAKTIVAGDCTSVSVSNVHLNGVALDAATIYSVTVNNFLAGGGDNFPTFATIDPSTGEDGGSDLMALVTYLGTFSPVPPPSTDRVNELHGDTPVGTITSDIVRGGSPPGSDRGVESAAVNLVADTQLWATMFNGADVAFMNPGGVRSDLTYLQSATEGDAVVTFGEAFTFQPFGNTLLTFQMSGAQIFAVLEEQCQPLGSSRPFLHLGVSNGFTYDLSKTIVAGDCTSVSVTNVQVNSVDLNPSGTYIVTANNFLADGGDNFATFATVDPSTRLDSGSDLQALVNFLGTFSPVPPPSTDRVNELP